MNPVPTACAVTWLVFDDVSTPAGSVAAGCIRGGVPDGSSAVAPWPSSNPVTVVLPFHCGVSDSETTATCLRARSVNTLY